MQRQPLPSPHAPQRAPTRLELAARLPGLHAPQRARDRLELGLPGRRAPQQARARLQLAARLKLVIPPRPSLASKAQMPLAQISAGVGALLAGAALGKRRRP